MKADRAFTASSCPLYVEAFDAEETVAVENEFSDVSETILAFVAVMGVLVHCGKFYN